MKYIDIENLKIRLPDLQNEYQSKRPFRYIVFENFFPKKIAENILMEYSEISNGQWNGRIYVNTEENSRKVKRFKSGKALLERINGK